MVDSRPDLAFAAVEHHAHRVAEFLAHMLGARRADVPVAVGRRRGDAAAEGRQQLLRHRMRGHAHGDACPGRRSRGRARLGARGSTSVSGPGQKRSRQLLARPGGTSRTQRVQEARAVEVHDQRVRRRPALELEDLAHRGGVLRVGAEAIDGLGRKRDQFAVAQRVARPLPAPAESPGSLAIGCYLIAAAAVLLERTPVPAVGRARRSS